MRYWGLIITPVYFILDYLYEKNSKRNGYKKTHKKEGVRLRFIVQYVKK